MHVYMYMYMDVRQLTCQPKQILEILPKQTKYKQELNLGCFLFTDGGKPHKLSGLRKYLRLTRSAKSDI